MTEKAAPINPLLIAGGMGLIGFLASDFVNVRDSRTSSVEVVVREVMDLKLEPLIADFRELKSEFREATKSARNQADENARRVAAAENNIALMEREFQTVEDRVGRLSDMIRERSLERMKDD